MVQDFNIFFQQLIPSQYFLYFIFVIVLRNFNIQEVI